MAKVVAIDGNECHRIAVTIRAYAGHREGRTAQELAKPDRCALSAVLLSDASGAVIRRIDIGDADRLSMIAPSVDDEAIAI